MAIGEESPYLAVHTDVTSQPMRVLTAIFRVSRSQRYRMERSDLSLPGHAKQPTWSGKYIHNIMDMRAG